MDAGGKDPFRNRDHIPEFDALVEEYVTRSQATRRHLKSRLNVPYGPEPDERLDLFFPHGAIENAPLHVFIHGGYWRMFSKDDFSYIAETATQCGAVAAIIGYSLIPKVRMNIIVEQVRRALHWLIGHARELGVSPERLTISGHSAGAHLASLVFSEVSEAPLPRHALLLSGIFELGPLQHSFLQPLIELTNEEVEQFSPARHTFKKGIKVSIAHGEKETLAFQEQALQFENLLQAQGLRTKLTKARGADHMTAVRDLGIAGTQLSKLLSACIEDC
jgi:arylformamidase